MATPTGIGPNQVIGGDFRVRRLIGEGGMGAVYLAVQQGTATERALKLMQRELVEDPEMRERFAQEARLGSRIESDHVVQVVAAGVDEETGIPWIAMELLRGMSLDRYLVERGPLGPGELRFLFEQLCHALGAAHDQGIVHRDLKPSNVFLAVPRVVGLAYLVKVLDFGIAKVLAEAKTTRTAAVGTPLYMAPEQYRAGRVTPASDVWALGLIAFELLTGSSYWKAAHGGDSTPAAVMFETCLGELRRASDRARELGVEHGLPQGFDDWFARCLSREQEGRYETARLAFDALAPLLGPAAAPVEPLKVDLETKSADRRAPAGEPSGAAPVSADLDLSPAGSDEAASSESEVDTIVTPPSTELALRPPVVAMVQTEAEPAATLAASPHRSGERGLTVAATAATTQSSWSPPELGRGPAADRTRLGPWSLLAAGALAALVAMLLASSLRQPSDAGREPSQGKITTLLGTEPESFGGKLGPPSEFRSHGALSVHGMLGHRKVPTGERTETYVMLEVRGDDAAPTRRAPVHLALVIDRSGSMSGERLRNAKAAAVSAVERLRDGDMVSVTAFDTHVLPVVPPTVLGELSRPRVAEAVRSLATGSDTCISCGIEAAMGALDAAPELVGRILLLSDGEANVAVRDVPGFRRIGRDAQGREVSITTIGVGVDYNERILSALSRESNGRHYYAQGESSLPRIFDAETAALGKLVATGAEARIELAEGAELVALLDRAHRVEGSTVIVPLGQFSRGEQKTVLMKVALAGHGAGRVPVCKVDIAMRGSGSERASRIAGSLATVASHDAGPDDVDSTVEVRAQRSETARALVEANELFAAGKPREADRELGTQIDRIERQKGLWASRGVEPPHAQRADLDDQSRSLRDARDLNYNHQMKN